MTGYTRDNTQVGFFAPIRFEADILDCEVVGSIPEGHRRRVLSRGRRVVYATEVSG